MWRDGRSSVVRKSPECGATVITSFVGFTSRARGIIGTSAITIMG